MKRYLINGELYCAVSEAARHLRTTAPKIRDMMGNGTIRYEQTKQSGPLVVCLKDIMDLKYKKRLHGT
jgi:hypothetical protein